MKKKEQVSEILCRMKKQNKYLLIYSTKSAAVLCTRDGQHKKEKLGTELFTCHGCLGFVPEVHKKLCNSHLPYQQIKRGRNHMIVSVAAGQQWRKVNVWVGEMSQWWKAPAAGSKDLDSVLHTHVMLLPTICNYNSILILGDPMPSLASVGTFMHVARINILRQVHEDIKKK